jgi:hypothetical protein
MNGICQFTLRQTGGNQEFFQEHFTRMGGNTISGDTNHGSNLFLSVIINDFNLGGAQLSPVEANAVLIIDADTVLTFPFF